MSEYFQVTIDYILQPFICPYFQMYKMEETFVLLTLSPSAINQIVLDSHVGGPLIKV